MGGVPCLGGGGTQLGQHREYLLHGGRYASCVHAGGLSCSMIFLITVLHRLLDKCRFISFRNVREQYLGILLERNSNRAENRNTNEGNIRYQRSQSVQTEPEHDHSNVQMNLIGRNTLHMGNS